jgi:hypothetical protein
MPARWIIPLQVFRLWGAVWLFGWAHHTQPARFALPAGIADVLVGPFAVRPRFRWRRAAGPASAWRSRETFWFTDIAFGIAVSAAIGLHLIETGFANVTPSYPAVMIGAFGVPQPALHADGRHLGHRRFLQT